MLETLAAGIQKILPQHGLSALVYRLMRSRIRWLKNLLITGIGKLVGIDFAEAMSPNREDYACFNDFFTRALKPGARPVEPDPLALISPADGRISECGQLDGDRMLQAKGVDYSLEALLAGDDCVNRLTGGAFFTIYLSPRDYHRVHMPVSGRLHRMIHVPGRLFSVAPYTVRKIPGLFALNERVVCIFDTAYGPFAQVLVGAMLVGSMATVWAGEVTPSKRDVPGSWDYADRDILLQRGEEMGRFNMGSTVVTVLPPGMVTDAARWPAPGCSVRMGERLVMLNPQPQTESKW